ncbi:DUF3333 domain-containing protein, partial [Emcibacteraceae bacterium]|nr:DUF3333 domain-containing protein [Emcibacteraceae bacterium]
MTDNSSDNLYISKVDWNSKEQKDRLKKRYLIERIFKGFAIASLLSALVALFVVLASVFITGVSGFKETRITLDINMDERIVGDLSSMSDEELRRHIPSINANQMIINALQEKFPNVTSRREIFEMLRLFSVGAQTEIRNSLLNDHNLIGETVTMNLKASSDVDMLIKGKISRE